MRSLTILLATAFVLALARAANFKWDCRRSPETCLNACFAFKVRRRSMALVWDKPTKHLENQRRRRSGCTMSNGYSVCGGKSNVRYKQTGKTQCDEYPFASTRQGGNNAILRCVALRDNASQGGQLSTFYSLDPAAGGCGGRAPCTFRVLFSNTANMWVPLFDLHSY